MTDYLEIAKTLLLGLTAGVLSGVFGIGGGLVIVPALVVFFGFPVKSAIGTSMFAILLPTGVLGVWEYWKNGHAHVAAGLWIAFGLFLGAYFGARLAVNLSQVTMKRLYAVFLLVVALYFLLSPTRPNAAAPCPTSHRRPPTRSAALLAVTSSTDRPIR